MRKSGTQSSQGQRLNIALLRDIPEERRRSMERFADGLLRAFDSSTRVKVAGRTVSRPVAGRRLGLEDIAARVTRFVYYPIVAAQVSADVYHVVDQAYADVAAFLPPQRTVATCHDLMLLRAEDGDLGFRGRRPTVLRYRWSTSFLRRMARVVCVS